MERKSSMYTALLKGTAIFGGVQVFTILISLVRGKLIAIILGPVGVGLISIFSTTVNVIQQITSLGLNLSAVKGISEAKESGDLSKIAQTIMAFRKLSIVTALIGGLAIAMLSSFLSHFTFKSDEYTWSFVGLSLMIVFSTLTNSEVSILQGYRRLKELAFSTVVGAFSGLLIGIPFYYFMGTRGIVPAMSALAIITFLTHRYHTMKINVGCFTGLNINSLLRISREMILLGVTSMLATAFGSVANYGVNAFITNWGSLKELGFFQAASSITNQYVGVLFSAMAVDYFPRLAAVASDNKRIAEIVNQQLTIIILLVAPIIIFIIISAPLLIPLLLSNDFLSSVPLVKWMAFGLFFKACSYPLGYISFSKGDKRIFFWFEGVFGNLLSLSLNIGMYYYLGMKGLGISFVFSFVIYFVLINYVVHRRYFFRYDTELIGLIFKSFLPVLIVFSFSLVYTGALFYLVCSFILLYQLYFSLTNMEKCLGIKIIAMVKEKWKK